MRRWPAVVGGELEHPGSPIHRLGDVRAAGVAALPQLAIVRGRALLVRADGGETGS